LPEASEASAKARQEFIGLALDDDTAWTYILDSTVFLNRGDYKLAQRAVLEACKLAEKSGNDAATARGYGNIGIVFYQLDNMDKALEYYSRALELYQLINHTYGRLIMMNNLGNVYDSIAQFEKALVYYNQALALCEKMGTTHMTALLNLNIGLTYEHLQDLPRALNYYTISYRLFNRMSNLIGVCSAVINVGRINQLLGKTDTALKNILQASAIADQVGLEPKKRYVNNELATIYQAKGDFKQALFHHGKYKELNDKLVNQVGNRRISELQTRFEVDTKEKEIALLTKDRELKELSLTRQRNYQNFLIAVSFLMVLLIFVLYTRYRLKTKTALLLNREMEERKRTETELLQSMKLETVGILAGGIAHDFNNLISVFMGNTAMVLENAVPDSQEFRFLQNAERISSQAADLAQRLVTFSKNGWLLLAPIHLETLLQEISDNYTHLQPLLQDVVIAPDLELINGDERQLRQVMLNLLKNADEAMAADKELAVEAWNIDLDKDNDFDLPPGRYVKIAVIDNGCGMAPEVMNRIPDFTTKGKSTGMGLAICHSIIRKHNGHISIVSQPDAGTTVTLYLPAYRGKK